jgi:hypothetical protein
VTVILKTLALLWYGLVCALALIGVMAMLDNPVYVALVLGVHTTPAPPLDPRWHLWGIMAAWIGIPGVSYFVLWPWRR